MLELLESAATGELFPIPIEEPTGGFRTVIVGGGLAGLLTALRISRDADRVAQGILLVESAPSLGGRLFFSDPGTTAEAVSQGPRGDFMARLERVRAGLVSGFGFEILSGDVAEVLERHLRASLSDDEVAFLEAATGQPSVSLKPGCWVVKKELTPWQALMAGSSELLTRKEATELAALVESPSLETLKAALAREPLVALLETVVRREVASLPASDVLEYLTVFFKRSAMPSHPASLLRRGGLELACELILRARGVQVRTRCRVGRIQGRQAHGFSLAIACPFFREKREVKASNVVMAVPLLSCFGLLPRDHFSANQSRGILKHPPSSLVALEYRDFVNHLQPEYVGKPCVGHQLLFPVERTQGFVTSAGHLVLFGYLDYEQSLDAPRVREAVARMRRAAEKLLNPESLQGLAGQSLVRNENLARERVVLLPVARYLESPGVTLRDVRMGIKGLYCCGDNFTFEPHPWKNVVQSVQDVVHHLAKD